MFDNQSHADAKVSSERSFALTFGAVLLLVSFWPLVSGGSVRLWAAFLSAGFFVLAFARPAIFALPNRYWSRLGVLLGHIVSPVVMTLLYGVVVLPSGLFLRVIGVDTMNRRIDRSATSYWIERDEQPGAMDRQF
ncbi:SxtJ family membrane protein [Aurantimonas sp. E1-2-R+4]|uniref:SxtJ family membrane protein n=1 Tax=Aurantimonas sp. E1-2-R+4 TaxID=3113714 RepID=UPI002F9272D7